MNRITITFDKLGFIERICPDEEVGVYVVSLTDYPYLRSVRNS